MDISIRKGETLELSITDDDITAVTVQLLVSDSDGNNIINETANFAVEDALAVATISTDDTDHAEGTYEYMLIITYSDGVIDKLPDVSECEGECDLPTITICKTLEVS